MTILHFLSSGKIQRICKAMVVTASLCMAGSAISAPVVFNFDTVALGSTTFSNGLGKLGSSSSIASYMNGVLQAAGYTNVLVSVSGAMATKTYNGENHVVGQTLGTSDNGVAHPATGNEIFIINDGFNAMGGGATDRFSMTFTNFLVQSVSYDWEIFPDATCPAGSTCARTGVNATNWPDFALLIGTNPTPIWYMDAPVPSSSSIDPQGLGVSGLIDIANGTNKLTFRDWPATIGIDNLQITGCVTTNGVCTPPTTVPEPSSSLLFGLGLSILGLNAMRRYRKADKSA